MRTPVKPAGRVYGYARVSVARPGATEGESLEVQRRKLEGKALQDGVTLMRVFEDKGVSGGRALEDRPEGKRLLSALKPGDTVIASKLDRMFRSASDALRVLEDFKRQHVSLILLDLGGEPVTGNGVSALVFTILGAVAQFERERIAERISEAKARQRERGRYLGGARPFGVVIRAGGTLAPNPKEQRAIATMRRLHEQGRSLRAIAATMQAKGFRLSHVAVQRVLAE